MLTPDPSELVQTARRTARLVLLNSVLHVCAFVLLLGLTAWSARSLEPMMFVVPVVVLALLSTIASARFTRLELPAFTSARVCAGTILAMDVLACLANLVRPIVVVFVLSFSLGIIAFRRVSDIRSTLDDLVHHDSTFLRIRSARGEWLLILVYLVNAVIAAVMVCFVLLSVLLFMARL